MKKYQHSETFNSLKSIKENISENLSTAEYLHTLDHFLWNALEPIAKECPVFFYSYISKCVAAQTLNANTKYTSNERQQLPLDFFNMLMESNSQAKFEASQKLYLNRGLLFGLLSAFSRATEDYEKLHSVFNPMNSVMRFTLMNAIEKSVAATRPDRLYGVIQQVKYWSKHAYTWKGFVIEKYVRSTLMAAQRTYVDFNHAVHLDDVTQIYLMVLSKAINRCDSRLGVLTTFITTWLKTARAQVADLAKRSNDESLDEMAETLGDSVNIATVMPDTSFEDMQEIAYKARLADPVGIVRTLLGLPQYVNAKHKKLLQDLSIG